MTTIMHTTERLALSCCDQEDVCEIIGNRHAYCSSSKLLEDKEAEEEIEFLERDPNMPNVGTRVRRGPDWKWKNQDGQGAGTIVGHGTRGTFLAIVHVN